VAENKKQAAKILKLEHTIQNYIEECEREIFFLRQTIKDLKQSAQMLPVVTKDMFNTINKQVTAAQKEYIEKHNSTVSNLWRLNQQGTESLMFQKRENKRMAQNATYFSEQIQVIGSQLAELSAEKDQLRNMVLEYYYEINNITQMEIGKLCDYMDLHYCDQLEKFQSFYQPIAAARKRVRTSQVRNELEDVILLPEE